MSIFEIRIRKPGASDNWSVECIHRLNTGPNHLYGTFQIENWNEMEKLANEPQQSEEYGQRLGKALFQNNEHILSEFISAVGKCHQEKIPLRVLLYIEDEELKTLRWEKLCAPKDGSWPFLRFDRRLTFSIYVPSPINSLRFPLISKHDLRALILVASPKNVSRLYDFNVETTVKNVKKALQKIITINFDEHCDVLANLDGIDERNAPTLLNLLEKLQQKEYTLLHIVCHGMVTRSKTDTILYWAKVDSQVEPVFGTTLIKELKARDYPLPHFTFLCACETASQEETGALGGLAGRLVRELGMPAVVAMTDKVEFNTAINVTERFYEHLKDSGEVDLALAKAVPARNEISDIIVPALFSRLAGLPLFSNSLEKEPNDVDIKRGLERLLNPEHEMPGNSEDEPKNKTLDDSKSSEKKYVSLIQKHAPILEEEFKEQEKILRDILKINHKQRNQEIKEKQNRAIKKLNKLCKEVFLHPGTKDFIFNDLALGENPPPYDARCPFRGLLSFGLKSRDLFFGREKYIEDLKQKLEENKFVAVIGGSGSGKSSLVKAGLISKLLKDSKLTQEELKQIVCFTPDKNPQSQLEEHLKTNSRPSILIVDQFEELFTISHKAEQQKFVNQLLKLIDEQQQRIVITMRVDFWEECANYGEKFRELIEKSQLFILPMTSEELRNAMNQQANKVGLIFEAGLDKLIQNEVEGEPGAMPLLQHALQELWKRRHGQWLLCDEYEKIGTDEAPGLKGAIARTAEDFYDGKDNGKQLPDDEKLSAEDKELVKNIFIRLTHLDENTLQEVPRRDTRQRVELNALIPNEEKRDRTREIVRRLANKRLVITSRDKQTEKIWVEVAHEALIRHWPRLQQWLGGEDEADRKNYILRQKIAQARADWKNSNRDKGNLLRGQRLEDALNLLSEKPDFFGWNEREYIEASKDERDRLEQEKLEASLDIGITSSKLLFVSNKRLDAIVNLIKTGNLLQKETKIAEHTKFSFLVIFNQLLNDVAEYNSINAHNSLITSVSCSPDNKTIASSCKDGTIKFWDWDGTCISEERIDDAIWDVAFNPDGDILASAGNNGTIQLWHINKQHLNRWECFKTIKAHHLSVYSISFNPKDKTFASAGENGTIKLWNQDGSPIKSLEAKSLGIPISAILHVTFSPDGKKLASAHKDGTIIIWDLKCDTHIPILKEHKREVSAVSFNHDSTKLVASSFDKAITLWNTNGEFKKEFNDYKEEVRHIAFSPNNEIVAAYGDGTIIFLSKDCNILRTLKGHGREVPKFSFSSNSNKMVSCSADKTIKFWCCNGKFEGHSNDIKQIDFSADGQIIATASTDGTAKLWKLDGNCQQTLYCYDGKEIYDVKFSRDGKVIATAGADGIIQLWRIDQNEWKPYKTFKGHTGIVTSLSFSPISDKIATADQDGSIKLWDLNGEQIGNITDEQTGLIKKIAFSPDGSMLSSASTKAIKLWDYDSGKSIRTFSSCENDNYCFCFSQDGKMIAIVNSINNIASDTSVFYEINVWSLNSELPNRKGINVFRSQAKDFIQSVKFSRDNKMIISIAHNGIIELWGLDGSQFKKIQIHDKKIEFVSFSPDWSSIAIVDSENKINLCNLNMDNTIKSACQQIDKYLTLNKLEIC